MKTLTIASTKFYISTDRLDATLDAITPVLQGFKATAIKYQDPNQTWEGDKVSSGFPPLDDAISFLTSSKFEATLLTGVELIAYAALTSIWMIVEISSMIWDSYEQERQTSYRFAVDTITTHQYFVKVTEALDEVEAYLKALPTEVKQVAINRSKNLLHSIKNKLESHSLALRSSDESLQPLTVSFRYYYTPVRSLLGFVRE